MAEIDIQKKKPSTWLWIIGLVVLALLIWLLVEIFQTPERGAYIQFAPTTTALVFLSAVDLTRS